MKIIIAGAGIAGLSIAHALVELGVRPTVIASDHGATAAGAGIVSAQFWDTDLLPYARRSQQIIRQLVAVNQCGMAQIALTEETANILSKIPEFKNDLPAEIAARFAPEFRRTIVAATFSPDDFWISNDHLLKKLVEGSDLVIDEVLSIEPSRIKTRSGEFAADSVIVAQGPGTVVGVEARLSQLARVETALPAMFHVLDSGIYMRPDGNHCLIGDGDLPWTETTERPAVLPDFLADMNDKLSHMLSCRQPCKPASAGVLAFTPDHRPIIKQDGPIWFVCGFGGDGLALAPAIGEIVASKVLDG